MQEKCILFELRWSPHCDFRSHDLLDVFHERRALSAFRAKRVDHDVILLSVNIESIYCPIRTNVRRCIDKNVTVGKIPGALTGMVSATVNNLPGRGCNDLELHRKIVN